MRLVFIFIFIFATQLGFASKDYLVELKRDSSHLYNMGFHIIDVMDDREQKENIGNLMNDANQRNRPVSFLNGSEKALFNYMDRLIHRDSISIPVKIAIKDINISTEYYSIKQILNCNLVLEYIDSLGNLIYMSDYSYSLLAINPAKKIDELISYTIKQSLIAFSLIDIESKYYFDLLKQPVLYDSILSCSEQRKGFYANFKEFQANNPSLLQDFEVIEVKDKANISSKIKIDYSSIDTETFLDLVYGFSDGQNVYIKRYLYGGSHTFIQIQELGRYCYIGTKTESQAVPILLPFVVGVTSIPYQQDYILNINSGDEHPLNEENLKIILEGDRELYKSYMNQPIERREEMGLYWLKQFNKRYVDKWL